MAKALIIAEKPSLGRSIVSALQWWKNEKFERQGKDRNTWLESDNYIVASSVGHLYELIDLDAYFPDYDPQNKFDLLRDSGKGRIFMGIDMPIADQSVTVQSYGGDLVRKLVKDTFGYDISYYRHLD